MVVVQLGECLVLEFDHFVFIFAPNGAKANFVILKHCIPLGMPMIVIQLAIPNRRYAIAISQPPRIDQIRFAIGCDLK